MKDIHWIRREEPGLAANLLYSRQTGEMLLMDSACEIESPASTIQIASQAPPCAGALTAPLKVFFGLTRECDLDCPMCFAKHRHEYQMPLTITVVDRIMEELAGMGVLEVRFTGGEPTLFPGFFDLVTRTDERGMNVSINTHGVYSAQKLRRLADAAVREFNISLDGPALIHDVLRGAGAFDRTVHTIRVLREAGKSVRINTMLFRDNIYYLKKMLILAESLGVGIRFCPIRSIGSRQARIFSSAHALSQSQWEQAKEQLRQMAKDASVPIFYMSNAEIEDWEDCFGSAVGLEKAKCSAWLSQLGIDPEGDVYSGGCIDDLPKSLSVGSVLELSMHDLWERSIRDTHDRLIQKFPHCVACNTAELWSQWREQTQTVWTRSNHLY